jgi:hypothetical protein
MNTHTAGWRVQHTTLIPLVLIIFGIFVWGVQYKVSLYDTHGIPARSIAQAKLLSPDERSGSGRTNVQLHPQLLPSSSLHSGNFLIASICFGVLPVRFVRAQALDSQAACHPSNSISSFFFFRPPPALSLA